MDIQIFEFHLFPPLSEADERIWRVKRRTGFGGGTVCPRIMCILRLDANAERVCEDYLSERLVSEASLKGHFILVCGEIETRL